MLMYIGVDVPMARWPVANWLLMLLTVMVSLGVWLKQADVGREERHLDAEMFALENNPKASPVEVEALQSKFHALQDRARLGALRPTDFHVSQLVTSQFVHGGFWHLLGNMIFLFAFGNAVNAKLGHPLYLGLYLGLGCLAGVGWLVLGPKNPVIGALGAIAGISGLFFVLYPNNELSIHSPDTYMYSGDAWRMPSWVFLIIYMALDLWGTMSRSGGVAYLCHLTGEVFGIMIASGLVLVGWITSDRGEQNLLESMGMVTAPEPVVRRRKKKKPKPAVDEE